VQISSADFDEPDLRVGNAGLELVAGRQLIGVELEDSGIDVDRCEFALIVRREPGKQFGLVNRVATSGDFLFAVAALCRGSRNESSM
jgi:hypothetical protein